jgi:hypothetical protein
VDKSRRSKSPRGSSEEPDDNRAYAKDDAEVGGGGGSDKDDVNDRDRPEDADLSDFKSSPPPKRKNRNYRRKEDSSDDDTNGDQTKDRQHLEGGIDDDDDDEDDADETMRSRAFLPSTQYFTWDRFKPASEAEGQRGTHDQVVEVVCEATIANPSKWSQNQMSLVDAHKSELKDMPLRKWTKWLKEHGRNPEFRVLSGGQQLRGKLKAMKTSDKVRRCFRTECKPVTIFVCERDLHEGETHEVRVVILNH